MNVWNNKDLRPVDKDLHIDYVNQLKTDSDCLFQETLIILDSV